MAKAKRPSDTNQRPKSIVDIATGETEDNLSKKRDTGYASRINETGYED